MYHHNGDPSAYEAIKLCVGTTAGNLIIEASFITRPHMPEVWNGGNNATRAL
jgi:hypothetical protein